MSWICPKCNYEIKTGREKHLNYCGGLGPRRIRISNSLKRGTIEHRIQSREIAKKVYLEHPEIRIKISNSLKGKSTGIGRTPEIETIRRNKIRDKINKRYSEGWQPVCGRAKKIKYFSPIAGDILLDGSWELAVAKYLDKNIKVWKRNTKAFSYFDKKTEKTRQYRPDFFVEDWNSFLEIKGYETDLDRCKWSQFPEKLIVWKKEELKKLKILE